MNPLDIITLTINVTCNLCGWTATYASGAHALAAHDAAVHVFEAHPNQAVAAVNKS